MSYEIIEVDLKSSNGDCKNRYQVSTETGEVLLVPVYESFKGDSNLIEMLKDNTLQPKRDYRYSRDLEELKELCNYSKYDKDSKSDLHIDGKLLDLMLIGEITPDNYKNFLLLAQHIQYRNVLVMNRKELSSIFNCHESKLYRAIKHYEMGGLISQIKPQGERGQNRVIVFNPQLVWKGDVKLKNLINRRILQNNFNWRK